MTKMASQENNKDSIESSLIDQIDATMQEPISNEKQSSVTSSIDGCDESNDLSNAEEKTNLVSHITNQEVFGDQKDANNMKSEEKFNAKISITDKSQKDHNNEMQGPQNAGSLPNHQAMDEQKSIDNGDNKESLTKPGYSLKRKRKTLNIPSVDVSLEESSTRSKRKKLKNVSDRFCWRCHKESIEACCTACPRSWHRKCIGGMPPSFQKWICGECASILRAENAETRSTAMAQLSIDQLCMLLKHVVERLRDYPGSEPFWKPVDLSEVPNYLDYVVKPMDLSLLEANVRSKLYGSTDAFMADAKWIQHNCIVFNTCGGVYADTSKLTNAAKQIIKVARQEVSEIEACPDCYAHGRNLPRPQPSWFIEPCRRPHSLVWAKLKGFPFWPAKAMPRVNSQGYVDVRFFGEHDRAWVSPKDLYLYSEEPPAPSPRKRKTDMDECVREITRHCRKLELVFGQFQFAPPKVQYNPNDPMQIKLMLPNYNPLEPNSYPNAEFSASKKKTPLKKRTSVKGKSQNNGSSVDNSEANINCKSAKGNVDDHGTESEIIPLKEQPSNSDDITNTVNLQNNLNDHHSVIVKSEKKEEQEAMPIIQNRTATNESKSAKNTLSNKSNNDSESSDAANTSATDKHHSPYVKQDETKKSSNENSSKFVTSPIRHLSSGVIRMQKKAASKNTTPKRDISQTDNAARPITKYTKGNEVYKPKTRMVDKLNAERALKSVSKENDKSSRSNPRGVGNKISLLSNNTKESAKKLSEIDITLSSPSASSNMQILNKTESRNIASTNLHIPAVHSPDKSLLLLVVNNGTAESAKKSVSTVDYQAGKDVLTAVHLEAKKAPRNASPKKESKARKTFPSRSHCGPQINQRSVPNTDESIIQISSAKRETYSPYQLLPPEAGPISARLHHNAQELVRRMGQLMEEAYKEAAQTNSNYENGTSDSHQATIYFLRMQIEHIKWQHQQQLAELKHNTERTLREMRASLEAEKLRSVEEARREAEEEKTRCMEEIKRKQWCAKCGKEALFYCCWNTAYCDYPCQQSHWSLHMRTCSQQPAFPAAVTSSSGNSKAQQTMPRLVLNAHQTSTIR